MKLLKESLIGKYNINNTRTKKKDSLYVIIPYDNDYDILENAAKWNDDGVNSQYEGTYFSIFIVDYDMIKKIYKCEPEKVSREFEEDASSIFRTNRDIKTIHDNFDYDFIELPTNQEGYEQL